MSTHNNIPATPPKGSATQHAGGAEAAPVETVSLHLANEAGMLKRKLERGIINTPELIGFLARVEVSSVKKVQSRKRDFLKQLQYLDK